MSLYSLNTGGSPLSRRDFLKLSASGVLGVALTELGSQNQESEGIERLNEMGLSNFVRFYKEGQNWLNNYGINPPLFSDILGTLNKVASGEITNSLDPGVSLLKFGWGENKEHMVEDAITHIKEMDIDTSSTGDDPEQYRKFLYSKVDKFPQAIMASSNKLKIVENYGYASNNEWGLPSLKYWRDPEFQEIALLHELEHLIQRGKWKDIKQYIEQEKFGDYLRIWLKSVNEISDQGIRNEDLLSPDFNNRKWHRWETAKAIFLPPSKPETQSKMVESLAITINEWQKRLGIGTRPIKNEDDIDEVWSTTATILATNLRWFKTLHPNGDRNTYIENNRDIIETVLINGYVGQNETEGETNLLFVEGWLSGISHHLVVPIETEWTNIPASKPTNPNNYLDFNYQALMQNAYLAAFSTLGDNPSQQEIREALDLPAIRIPTPIACLGSASFLYVLSLLARRMKNTK